MSITRAKRIVITPERDKNFNIFTRNWRTSKHWSINTTLKPWATPKPASHGLNQTLPFALHHLNTHTPCIMMVISLAYVKYLSLSFKVACVVTWTAATKTDLSITRTNNLTESKQEHVVHTCRTFVDVCKCVVAISFSTAFFIKLILYWATFFLYFCFCIIVNILRNFFTFFAVLLKKYVDL